MKNICTIIAFSCMFFVACLPGNRSVSNRTGGYISTSDSGVNSITVPKLQDIQAKNRFKNSQGVDKALNSIVLYIFGSQAKLEFQAIETDFSQKSACVTEGEKNILKLGENSFCTFVMDSSNKVPEINLSSKQNYIFAMKLFDDGKNLLALTDLSAPLKTNSCGFFDTATAEKIGNQITAKVSFCNVLMQDNGSNAQPKIEAFYICSIKSDYTKVPSFTTDLASKNYCVPKTNNYEFKITEKSTEQSYYGTAFFTGKLKEDVICLDDTTLSAGTEINIFINEFECKPNN